jgi:methionine-rich copper-binding protein CopC
MKQLGDKRRSAFRLAATILLVSSLTITASATARAIGRSFAFEQAAPTRLDVGARVALSIPSPETLRPAQPIVRAHAIIVRTSPPQGGVAETNIGKVDVWYDAGIRDAFAALAVVSASGERVDKRDAAIDSADPAHVSVGVNPLTGGKYTVRYRALSADGHLVSGAWEFEVRP